MATFKERVQAGMAWLDENHPGWIHRVDVNRIDDRFSDLSILGQVTGSGYLDALAEIRQRDTEPDKRYPLYDLGFTDVEYPVEINVAWQEAIRQRIGK